jgi:hypothetical protein
MGMQDCDWYREHFKPKPRRFADAPDPRSKHKRDLTQAFRRLGWPRLLEDYVPKLVAVLVLIGAVALAASLFGNVSRNIACTRGGYPVTIFVTGCDLEHPVNR